MELEFRLSRKAMGVFSSSSHLPGISHFYLVFAISILILFSAKEINAALQGLVLEELLLFCDCLD